MLGIMNVEIGIVVHGRVAFMLGVWKPAGNGIILFLPPSLRPRFLRAGRGFTTSASRTLKPMPVAGSVELKLLMVHEPLTGCEVCLNLPVIRFCAAWSLFHSQKNTATVPFGDLQKSGSSTD